MHANLSTTTSLLWLVHVAAWRGVGGAAAQSFDVELGPSVEWTHCITDGRLDIHWSVDGNNKMRSGLLLPGDLKACKAATVRGCKWIASCRAVKHCQGFHPGELSGREKCLLVVNPSNSTSVLASIQLDLVPAGNWGAIILGITLTSLALMVVVGAGCYSDLHDLVAAHRHAARPRPAPSMPLSPLSQDSCAAPPAAAARQAASWMHQPRPHVVTAATLRNMHSK